MNSLAVRSLQHMQLGLRGLRTTPQRFASGNVAPKLKKMKQIQEEFQVRDGHPVFLKRGLRDRVLYHVTIFMSVVGVGMSLEFIYSYVKPK